MQKVILYAHAGRYQEAVFYVEDMAQFDMQDATACLFLLWKLEQCMPCDCGYYAMYG